MNKLGVFRRYWGDIGTKINKIAARRSAKAFMPDVAGAEALGDGLFKITFDGPAFFYNAPQKGSSTKSGQSHRQGIFIDGTFTVRELGTQVVLTNASCNLSIYDTALDDCYTLTLVEAMHFDMEQEVQSEFHPMFHVQRGVSNTLTSEQIIHRAKDATRLPEEKIVIAETPHAVGLSYLRLPTPQMDYFAVLATVTADFFCSAGQSDRSAKDEFRELLRSLLGSKNMMRDGLPSRALRGRWSTDMPWGPPIGIAKAFRWPNPMPPQIEYPRDVSATANSDNGGSLPAVPHEFSIIANCLCRAMNCLDAA